MMLLFFIDDRQFLANNKILVFNQCQQRFCFCSYDYNKCSKCPPFARTQARIKSRTPLVDRIVNDALFQTVPHLNQTTLQIVNISHLRLVNTFLHRTPHFVIHNVEKILKIGQYLPKIWAKV